LSEIIRNFLAFNQCPWDRHAIATIHFCEAQLCQWIVKPAETWSNIGFVIFGLWALILARREGHRHLQLIGAIGIAMGFCSALFHATGTFWGEYLDVSSMILFVTMGLSFNIQRWKNLGHGATRAVYFSVCAVVLTLMLIVRPIGIPLFGLLFIIAVIIEWRIYHTKAPGQRADYRFFKAMAASFLLALVVWTLDLTKIVCDPDNHWFNGHAFWHLVCGLNPYFIYRFYTQFTSLKVPGDLA
jgi:hypothetical protein